MALVERHIAIDNIQSMISLPRPGESLVIRCPGPTLAGLVMSSLERGCSRTSGCIAISGHAKTDGSGKRKSGSAIDLSSSHTEQEAIHVVSAHLRKSSSRIPALFLLVHPFPSWSVRPKSIQTFFESLHRQLKNSSRANAWVFSDDLLPSDIAGRCVDNSDYFFDILEVGSDLYGQFLKFRGSYESGLFLPRRMTITGGELRLDLPSVPVLASPQEAPPTTDAFEVAYRTVFDGFPKGLVLFSIERDYREVNRRAAEILGYRAEELRTVRVTDLVHPSHKFRALKAIAALKKRKFAAAELLLVRKSGRTVTVEVSASRLPDGRYAALLQDVTAQRKEREEANLLLEMKRMLVESSPLPQALAANRRITTANQAFRETFNWLHFSEGGKATVAALFGKANADLVQELDKAGQSSGEVFSPIRRDVAIVFPDGSPRDYQIVAMPLVTSGGPIVHLSFVDITDRQRMLRELADSEHRFRTLIDNSIGPACLVQDGHFSFVNRAFLELFGYLSAEHVVGQPPAMIVAPRERETIGEQFDAGNLAVHSIRHIEMTGVTSDGRRLALSVAAQRVNLGEAPALLCYWRDRSQEKKAERDVRRHARELDIADKVLSALHVSIEPSEVKSAGLTAAMKWLGFECGGVFDPDGDGFVLGLTVNIDEPVVNALSLQSATEGLAGYAVKTSEPLVLTTTEYPPHLPYRSLFEANGYRTIVFVPLMFNGRPIALLLTLSKRVFDAEDLEPSLFQTVARHFSQALGNALAVEEVKKLEDRYRRAVDALEDVVYHARPNGSIVYISPQVEGLLGHRPDEFVRSPELWRSLCHPDDHTLYSRRISDAASDAGTIAIEYRILPKGKATYRWIRELVRYRRNEKGELTGFDGVVSDVTEAVERRESISRTGVLARSMLTHADEGIAVLDATMTCSEWNDAMEKLTGVRREDVIGMHVDEKLPGFDAAEFSRLLHSAGEEEVVAGDVSVPSTSDRPERTLSVKIAAVKDGPGDAKIFIVFAANRSSATSDDVQAHNSEETLRNIIDAMGDALLISDLEGKIWDVNKEFLAVTGYSRAEVVEARFPYPWLIEDEMAKMVIWIGALREKRFLRDFDMTWRRRDGRDVAISLNTTLLRNAKGEPYAMLNIARNITERKRLSNELAAKNRQIEMLNRIISKANSTVEFADVFNTIAREVGEMLPFDQMSVALLSDNEQSLRLHACVSTNQASLPVGSIVPLARTVSREAVKKGVAQVFSDLAGHREFGPDVVSVAEGLKSEISIPIMLNERILGTFNIGSTSEASFVGPELTYLQPIADQIGALIDRTQLFQRVSDDSTYIHNLLNSIESVVYTVDPGYRIREVNKAWASFAALQELGGLLEERAAVGRRLDEIVKIPGLWNELRSVMPRLFARHLEIFSREVELGHDNIHRTFHLVVSPMVINERVTSLVFTFTDITETKQREAEIRRRNRELTALNAIATSIGQSLKFDEVLDIASEGILGLVGAKVVMCYVWDSHRALPVLVRYQGLPEATALQLQSEGASSNLAAAVISGKEPAFISRGLTQDRRLSALEMSVFQQLDLISVACLPLLSKDRVRGSLLVGFTTEHDFNEQEEKFLELVGNTISSAIENAQLYAEVQDQVRVITSLFELGKRLTGALDRKSVLEVLSNETRKSIPFAMFAFDASVQGGSALQRVFAVGEPALFNDVDVMAAPDEIHRRALESGQPLLGTDAHDHAVIAVPIRSENTTTGLLTLTGPTSTAYDDTHLRLFESIANLAGIALDRAVLYDDTVAKSLEIEQRNRELDDFTYVVSHDLKEPLITIEGYSKIVLNDYQERLDPQGKEFLLSVVQSTARMKRLIDDLLTLSRVGRAGESTGEVSVAATLNEVLRDFQFTLRSRNAIVDVPSSLPVVRFNPTELGMVFRNLIGNGLKFNDKPEPRIAVNVTETDQEFTFTVADNGIGIERQHFEKIFVIFQRLNLPEEYQGTGAGLTIVKKIVENHHGRIWLDSEPGKGTTFFFTIPK